jgi:hypothetical protein
MAQGSNLISLQGVLFCEFSDITHAYMYYFNRNFIKNYGINKI